jgi:hypothetical protein
MLPFAKHTCHTLKMKGTDFFLPPLMRVSSSFHAERLVEETCNQNLLVRHNGDILNGRSNASRFIKALPAYLSKQMLRPLGVYEDDHPKECQSCQHPVEDQPIS